MSIQGFVGRETPQITILNLSCNKLWPGFVEWYHILDADYCFRIPSGSWEKVMQGGVSCPSCPCISSLSWETLGGKLSSREMVVSPIWHFSKPGYQSISIKVMKRPWTTVMSHCVLQSVSMTVWETASTVGYSKLIHYLKTVNCRFLRGDGCVILPRVETFNFGLVPFFSTP